MTVFYRKYRPQKLAEIVGQDHITKTLAAQLEKGKISHAYLFCGPKGSGKTTTARILAKAVNCLQFTVQSKKEKTANGEPKTESFVFGEPCDQCDSCQAILADRYLDVIEIDAASNRGIDDIRDLREKIKLAPVGGRYKVYIVDEVHMLTTEAFNALLKTLEEPPSHAIFVLCTTAAEKLPATIISRCQRFDFTRAQEKELLKLLRRVSEKEKLEMTEETLGKIAKRADGSFRDALSFLDQLATTGTFSQDEIEKVLSYSSGERVSDFTQYLIEEDAKKAILALNSFVELGVDLKVFLTDLLSWLRYLLFYKEGVGDSLGISQFTQEVGQKLEEQAESVSRKKILELLRLFSSAVYEIRTTPIPQLPIEIAIAQSCPQDEGSEKDKEQKEERKEKREKEEAPEEKIENKSSTSNSHTQPTAINIGDDWPKVLEKLKVKSGPLFTLLARCQPKNIEDGKLILDVPFKFHKERLEERGSRYLIERALCDFFDQPIKVEFLLKKEEKT